MELFFPMVFFTGMESKLEDFILLISLALKKLIICSRRHKTNNNLIFFIDACFALYK